MCRKALAVPFYVEQLSSFLGGTKMGYRIGLDLGISSVGWAVLEDDVNGEPKRIIDLGSRIFDAAENPKDGAPLAQPRREARGLRRRLRRRTHRIKRTKQLLEKYKIISIKELEEVYSTYKFQFSPYELRVQALDSKLTNVELARILVNFVKKRGYKSNSKSEEENSKSDAGKLLTATKENEELMKEKGYRTVAEMYLKDEKFTTTLPDGTKLIKIKNSPNEYRNTPLRKLLVDEIRLILKKQQEFNSLITDEFIEEYIEIFESQRSFDEGPGGNSPYGGNQIEKMLGKCTFEDEYRAPKACYTFEYFKLLQDINHIKIEKYIKLENGEINREKRELTEEEKKKIIELVKDKVTVTYDTLRTVLDLSDFERFNMISYNFTNIFSKEINKESEKAKKIEEFKSYHKMRVALDKYQKNYIKELSSDEIDQIGYALSVYKNDDKREKYLNENVPKLPKEAINELLKLNFSKVGNLSIKCMKKIIPALEQGMTYDKAVGTVYDDFRGKINTEKKRKLSINDLEQSISNPVVRRSVSQTIKVINAITNKYNPIYGKPDVVVIELARELGKSRLDRSRIEKSQTENREKNEEAKKIIEELGKADVTGQDIVKYKLWKEQKEICIYSGKHISIEDLFTEAVEVDHIIPYSMCFDDSYNNKVLVVSGENRQKGNRVPYQYMEEAGRNLEEYEVRVNQFISNYNKKKKLLKERISEEDRKTWKTRNLNDTRYITKVIYSLLNNYMQFSENENFERKIWTVNGQVTAYMRKRWGIEKIRADGDEHHAVDATVVASVSQRMINKITKFSQYMEARYIKNNGEYVDEDTGEIISKREYEERFGNKFPEPWVNFRKELEIRTTCQSKERMEECIKEAKIYSYNEIDDNINRYNDLEPIFISRMPRRKVKGQAHQETIRGLKKEGNILKTVTKTDLINLKLKDGEIDKYPEKQKKDDRLLYEALVNRLKKFGGDGKKAFAEPFYKPKADGTQGPIVKKVKLEEKTTLGVELPARKAIADNGSMVRVDVFYVENDGYYFVPIYIADTMKKELPDKACIASKPYSEWKEMNDKDFIFSLYPNDLIHIEGKNKIKLNGRIDKTKGPKEADDIFAYYIKAGISTAALKIINHDGEYEQESLGIKKLKKIEKYEVDVLGNYNKIKLPEKRLKFNLKKGKEEA